MLIYGSAPLLWDTARYYVDYYVCCYGIGLSFVRLIMTGVCFCSYLSESRWRGIRSLFKG